MTLEGRATEDVNRADHAVHGRAQLVGHGGEERGLRSIRLLRLFARLVEVLSPERYPHLKLFIQAHE